MGQGWGCLADEPDEPSGRCPPGSGRTPFSRNLDGRAVLRSCIREFLASEAMHGLRVATSRAFARSESELNGWKMKHKKWFRG